MRKRASLAHSFLLKAERFRRFRAINRCWQAAWSMAERRYQGPIATHIHGYPVVVNFGYTYPLYARMFPSLNNPLLEIAHQTFCAKGRPIVVVDIGAAVGDTVLFLRANCGTAIRRYVCIDGDGEFLGYLQNNMAQFADVTIIATLLSDGDNAPELVRTHAGTASPQGATTCAAQTLDRALQPLDEEFDLIKIDVDGFDGRVLSGAASTIDRHHPSILFEWHPLLYQGTHSSVEQPFRVLAALGYDRFLWFTKFGAFSHFGGANAPELAMLAQVCLRNRLESDWHYDVVALHQTSAINPIELAECDYARHCTSRF